MSRRGGSRSSFGVLQIVLGVAVLLGVGIVLAMMFAPEKPPAPPSSKVTYRAESPREKKSAQDDLAPIPEFDLAKGRVRDAAPVVEQKEEAPAEKPFKVTGTVIDLRSKAVVADAVVTVRRVWTPAEQRDWEAREAQAKLGTDQALFRTLREERARLQLTERTRTNETGRFEVGSDVPGIYEVEAVHRQYMKQVAKAGTLSVEAPLSDVEVGLGTGASISGKVTELGSPTPAVDVRVMIEKDGIHSARTNEKGEYKIEGIAPGDYGVLVNTSGSAYKPGPTLPYQKVTLQTASQELRGVDFEVEAAGVVWGYVRTPDNQPIKGADVLLTSRASIVSQAITSAIKQAPPVRGRSEDDGYYELLGVPINEEWRVYATSKEASPQLAEPFMLTSEVRSVQIDVFMYGGSDVRGFVVDNKGQAISDAQVACIPSYSEMFTATDAPAAFREARSGPDGSFTIEKLPMGDYQLLARKQDFKIPTAGVAIYPDGASPIENVEVTLLPVDEGSHYVMGTVSDAVSREMIAGADVELQGFGTETMNNFSRTAKTDSKGAYNIDGLEAGSYRLVVRKDGYAPKSIARILLDTSTPVVLNQSGVVRGRVLVKETNRPPDMTYYVRALSINEIGGVDANRSREMNDENATSFNNTDGSFQLFVSAGNYQLKASAPEYTPSSEMIQVAAGQVVDGITLYLSSAGGSIAGRVSTSDGELPVGAEVALIQDGSMGEMAATGGPQRQRVGEGGEYIFTNLEAGYYHVIASHPNYANGRSRSVELSADTEETGVDIVLNDGGVIAGRVLQSGKPQAGATVTALSLDSGSTGTGTTDASGMYSIESLGTGQYSVTVILAGGGLGAIGNIGGKQVEVIEGRTTTVDFGADPVTFRVTCTPPPVASIGVAMLQQVGAGAPSVIQLENIGSLQYVIYGTIGPLSGGSVELNTTPGEYQLIVYYAEGTLGSGGGNGSLKLVYSGNVTIQGNDAPFMVPVQF